MGLQVFSKALKGRTVVGVAAGRFHTVLWTREAVYTMGLNGGQLGETRHLELGGPAPFQVLALRFRSSIHPFWWFLRNVPPHLQAICSTLMGRSV